ncbi:class I SAM-dependent methyltransferase [Larkinella humicola]|uniref:Class I SAM-dependent methyltransferase n=1 Tax=Larkinella humicola TaxID=2607654 RepID=A0A5N1JQ37_9BACT|nr:class I SAM-dependent methyltransferase [Larkinella humicola]KAA9356729.1 class I SAM-dependent methyltransferase [Larkinella humicola]
MAAFTPVDTGFDGIAPFYDALSRLVFGNSLRKAQVYWLGSVPQKADILVLGGGSGWLLSRILAVCDPRSVLYIDASPVMISLAKKEVKNDSRVIFRVGTETAIWPGDGVDVLFTPFVLDLFTEERLQTQLLPRLLDCLHRDGYWFCCDFDQPVYGWQRLLLWAQYRFFRTLSHIEAHRLPHWLTLLNSLPSLRPVESKAFFGKMILSGCWQKTAVGRPEQAVR